MGVSSPGGAGLNRWPAPTMGRTLLSACARCCQKRAAEVIRLLAVERAESMAAGRCAVTSFRPSRPWFHLT